MELSLHPDVYVPSIDERGRFVDVPPAQALFNKGGGLRCPCCARADKTYVTRTQFAAHTKTKTHREWIERLSSDRTNPNHLAQLAQNETTIRNQRLLLANLENEIVRKDLIIAALTSQLVMRPRV